MNKQLTIPEYIDQGKPNERWDITNGWNVGDRYIYINRIWECVDNTTNNHANVQDNSDKIKNDQDANIEANKLTDADEKVVEAKKYNGIIWFIGVFVVLLIVVFAFT